MKKLVSVVILNWNGKKHLIACITSLQATTYKPLEIIVVDNNSSDGSVEQVRKQFNKVTVVANTTNIGYSAGNNAGIKKSRGEYVLVLNNDTEVDPSFLEPLVHALEKDPKIGCIQPKLLYASNHSLLNAVGSYLTSTGFLYHYGYRKNSSDGKYNRPLSIFSAKGAAMLLRKKALDKVGLLDEDFFIYFEETDLCHRLWLAGYTVVYEPSSIIYHHEAVDTKRQFNAYFPSYLSMRNRIISFVKTLEAGNLIRILGALGIVYSALFVYYTITFQFSLARSILAGVWWNIRHVSLILEKRRDVQRLRKKTDAQLFPFIKHNPPLAYYYYLFTTLKNYTDEKVIDQAKFY